MLHLLKDKFYSRLLLPGGFFGFWYQIWGVGAYVRVHCLIGVRFWRFIASHVPLIGFCPEVTYAVMHGSDVKSHERNAGSI